MTTKCVAALTAWACLIASGASAATATGRITYITPDRQRLMLDNSDMYVVSPAVDLSSVAVADWVRINWDKKGREDVITSLVKTPLAPGVSG